MEIRLASMRSISKAAAWLCLLLMLASAWAALVHRHTNEANSSSCQLCIVAHSLAPARAAASPKPVFRRVRVIRHQILDAKQRLLAFSLHVRPPPSA